MDEELDTRTLVCDTRHGSLPHLGSVVDKDPLGPKAQKFGDGVETGLRTGVYGVPAGGVDDHDQERSQGRRSQASPLQGTVDPRALCRRQRTLLSSSWSVNTSIQGVRDTVASTFWRTGDRPTAAQPPNIP